MPNKKYYRFIVMFTMSDEERETFLKRIIKEFPKSYQPLVDQSTFILKEDCVPDVKGKILKCCPETKIEPDHFVKIYYSAALVELKNQYFDYIIEDSIW